MGGDGTWHSWKSLSIMGFLHWNKWWWQHKLIFTSCVSSLFGTTVTGQRSDFHPKPAFCSAHESTYWYWTNLTRMDFCRHLLGFQHTDGEQEEPGDDCISSSLRAEDAGLCFDLLEGPRCRDVNGRKLSRNSNVCLFQVLVVSNYWAPWGVSDHLSTSQSLTLPFACPLCDVEWWMQLA